MNKNSTARMKKVLRIRNSVVNCQKSGEGLSEISKKLKIPLQKVREIVKLYEERGETYLKNYSKPPLRIATSLTEDEKVELEEVLINSCAYKQKLKGGCKDVGHWTVVEFQALVLKMFGVRVPMSEGLIVLRGLGLSVVHHQESNAQLTNHTLWRDQISDEFKEWKKNVKPKQLTRRESRAVSLYKDPDHYSQMGRRNSAQQLFSKIRIKYQLTDSLVEHSYYVTEQLAKWEEKLQKKESK
ncbi:hypothetical protein [Rubritalea profundi]|nr:hypothetical protein [Rubritalea profundi]